MPTYVHHAHSKTYGRYMHHRIMKKENIKSRKILKTYKGHIRDLMLRNEHDIKRIKKNVNDRIGNVISKDIQI